MYSRVSLCAKLQRLLPGLKDRDHSTLPELVVQTDADHVIALAARPEWSATYETMGLS
jgi:hypothetical protein